MDLRNKKVTVVGLGSSGFQAGLLLLKQGASVAVTDKNDDENVKKSARLLEERHVKVEVGRHTKAFLKATELMVVSPGVENSSLPVRYARKEGIPIIGELELAYRFSKGPLVAVTGTNGKSTVVSLLGEIFRKAEVPVNVCGNIGNPFSGEVQRIGKDTVVILEVSSFQLEHIISFRPKIAIILNVTDDHLDRHASFREYFNLKTRIFENQKKDDAVILNYSDGNLRKLAKLRRIPSRLFYFSATPRFYRGVGVNGAYFDKNEIKISSGKRITTLFRLGDSKLKGAHNLENILAASLAASLLGVNGDSIRFAVENFTPLVSRFERVATIEGVEFIDDSKATNVDSTYKALLSLEKPTILIAGGRDKNLLYEKILPAAKNIVKKIVLIGKSRSKMRKIFEKYIAIEESDSLEEAVSAAYRSASPGEAVLLSPMCSSFDMFRDYKHRGEVFRKAVKKLTINTSTSG